MCLVKKPKVVSAADQAAAQKDPAALRNPYLDGINPLILARSKGLASLRIDRSPSATQASPLTITR